MIEFDEYKVKLNNIRPRLDALADSLGIEAAKEEIDRLHAQIDSEGFWDNQEISQKVMKQSRTLEAKVARYEKMCSQWDDLYTLCEMALEDNDDSMLPELTEGYAQLEQEMETHGLRRFFPANMTITTPSSRSRRAQAAPRRRTGPRCSTGCTRTGPSSMA